MRLPLMLRETFLKAKDEPAWGLGFLSVLLIPWMLIFARAGMEICGALIGLAFLWHSARARQWAWCHTPFFKVCLVIWAWLVIIVTPLAVTPEHSLATSLTWIRFPLLTMALCSWILAPAGARHLLGGMLAALLAFVVIDTVWQYATQWSLTGHQQMASGRLTGPFTGPKVGLYLSKIMLPTLGLCLAFAVSRRHWKIFASILVLLMGVLVAILMSGERSALLSSLLACGITVLTFTCCDKRWRLYGLLAGVIVAIILSGVFMSSDAVHARVMSIIEVISHYPQSDYGVLAIAGLEMGAAHWFHGVGLRNFSDLCPILYYQGKAFTGLHPHNFYIEWFVETGIVGLGLFLALLVTLMRVPFKLLQRSMGWDRLLPSIAMGIMVQHFFPLIGTQSFFANWSSMLIWYGISILFAALPNNLLVQHKSRYST